jgi:D-alanyl-D-alanine carboxypeptidase/D-alanyl-D-alanine-endopeptidase (penicillin-binding protein 4)
LARFGEVAARLQRLGVRAVRDILLDPGSFTGPARPASWPQNQLHAYYCAPTGPFVLEQGVFRVAVDPRAGASKARVSLVAPPFGPRIENRTQVVRSKQNPTCGAIDRGDSLLVRGRIWRRSPAYEFRTSVADPTLWYARALRGVLARAGIAIAASARPAHDGLVHEVTTGLGPALLRTLRDSSNFDAEQLVRVLGAEVKGDGSLAGGMAAMREGLQDLVGALPPGVALIDGSGLSKDNRVTPELLARALHGVRTRPLGWTLFQALPVAGETGSLEHRFAGSELRGRVHAKTGWIRGASSLSGYVEAADGEQYVFSILIAYDRNKGGMNKHFKRLQEAMVEAIAAGRT